MQYTNINPSSAVTGKTFLLWAAKQYHLGCMAFTKQAGVLRLIADHIVAGQMGFGLTGTTPVLGLQKTAFDAITAIQWNDADIYDDEYLYLTTPMIAEPAEMHMDAVPVQLWLPINPVSVAGLMKRAIEMTGRIDIEQIEIISGRPVVAGGASGFSAPHQPR